MSSSRRAVLRAGLGIALGGLAAGAVAGCGGGEGSTGRAVRSAVPLPEPFTAPLPLLERARVRASGAEDLVELDQVERLLEVLPGRRTAVLTYGGAFPGLLVESRSGRPVRVRHHNRLSVPTVAHLHGGHSPSASDGFPTDHNQPGGTREHHYPMAQRAATLWYHDHTLDRTGYQVNAGLLGLHLVRDDEEEALGLPAGERELPLVVVDRAFGPDAELLYPSLGDPGDATSHRAAMVDDEHLPGVLGDVMLVNGAPWPEAEVDAARYRLRILNGCSARRLALALDPPPSDGPAFTQVGSDGGLLELPVGHDELPVAQAERFDVVVDFSRWPVGSRVELVNRLGSGGASRVMRFHVVRRGADDSTPAERLAELDRLSEVERLVAPPEPDRTWRFTRGEVAGTAGWTVNGREFDPERMDAVVPLGRVERWRLVADMHHPVHVHLDPVQVLSRAGRPPLPSDAGWKDTVDLRPGEHADVAVRFTTHAGRYVVHCHNLEHEDRMMMAAFATV